MFQKKRLEPQVDSLEHLFMVTTKIKNPIDIPWDPNALGLPFDMPFYIA